MLPVQSTRSYCQVLLETSGKSPRDACEQQQTSPNIITEDICIVTVSTIKPNAKVISGTCSKINVLYITCSLNFGLFVTKTCIKIWQYGYSMPYNSNYNI